MPRHRTCRPLSICCVPRRGWRSSRRRRSSGFSPRRSYSPPRRRKGTEVTNLATNLVNTAAREGHRPAVRLDDLVLSYADLDDRSARVASWLTDRGVGKGARVGIMLPNVIEFAVLYYGALRSGAAVVPMNPLLKSREVQHYLGDSGSSLVFASSSAVEEASIGAARAGATCVHVDSTFMELIAACPARPDVVPRGDDDTAVILYTSGTT